MFILHVLCAADITAAYNSNAHLCHRCEISSKTLCTLMLLNQILHFTLAHFQTNKQMNNVFIPQN